MILDSALLQICRQTRQEARAMFYLQNNFQMTVYDCNDTLLQAFGNLQGNFGQKRNIDLELEGHEDWKNLVAWCKSTRGNGYGLKRKDEPSEFAAVICAAQNIAIAAKSLEKFEDALECYRPVACMVDEEWGEDFSSQND